MFPGQTKYFIESYNDATSKPFGYLLIDYKPETPDFLRLRTDILSGLTDDRGVLVYIPKKK